MGTNYFRRDARDIEFLLFEHMDVDKLLSYEAYRDFSVDDFRMIIDEAMKVAQEVLVPAMQDGDHTTPLDPMAVFYERSVNLQVIKSGDSIAQDVVVSGSAFGSILSEIRNLAIACTAIYLRR